MKGVACARRKDLMEGKAILSTRQAAMKCLGCGAENPAGVRLCRSCGKPLVLQKEGEKTSTYSNGQTAKGDRTLAGYTKLKSDGPVDYKDIPSRMKIDYQHDIRDSAQKSLDGLQSLLSHLRRPQMNIDELLLEAANMIWRQLGIDNVAIGLRDPKDGIYKYRTMVGFRDDAIEAHRQIAYRKEQFFADGQFIGTDISKYSRLYLAEDNVLTEEERKAFNRPGLLTMRRRTALDSLEGDYIDTRIYGTSDELLGWIEVSGTRLMKLPDAATVRWIETIASIIGAALMYQDARKGLK
jgi:ribosomal protein L40E